MNKSQQEMQSVLEDVIDELSKDTNIINKEEEYINKLKNLYEKRFIHLYSHFYSTIEVLALADEGVIQTIGQNLDILEVYVLNNYYNPLLDEDVDKYEKESKIYKQILKFCDHLRLEIARRTTYNNYKKESEEVKQIFNDTNAEVTSLSDKVADTNAEVTSLNEKAGTLFTLTDKAIQKVDKMNMDVVTVLGIFAAIIMAFAGGFSFLDGTIKALSTNVNIVKLLIMAFGCGAVIFNLIYFLLFAIGKITNKTIFKHWGVILIIDGVLLLVGIAFYFGYLYFNPTIIINQ